jgi:hypothetical protein
VLGAAEGDDHRPGGGPAVAGEGERHVAGGIGEHELGGARERRRVHERGPSVEHDQVDLLLGRQPDEVAARVG